MFDLTSGAIGLCWEQKTSTYRTAGKPSIQRSVYSEVAMIASLPRLRPIDWRLLYRSAILETNKMVLPQRVLEAEAAVIARRREIFYADGMPEEKEALEDRAGV
jgi:hypothetical protein